MADPVQNRPHTSEYSSRPLPVGDAPLDSHLAQLRQSIDHLPWLKDALDKAMRVCEQPLDVVRRVTQQWNDLPAPLRDTFMGMVPFGDGLDLVEQAMHRLQGKAVDPVVVTLGTIGLAADLGWLDGVLPDPADVANFAASFLKGMYKSMGEPAKAMLQQVVQQAAQSREGMEQLVKQVGRLAPHAAMLARHPDALPRLLKLDGAVLSKVVSDPKLLEPAIGQSEVLSKSVGKRFDQLAPAERTELEKFYKVYPSNSTDKATTVLRQHQDVGLQLHIDKHGMLKEGSPHYISPLRITTTQMRTVLEKAGAPILKEHAIHHKIPISVAEKHPLVQAAMEHGYDINSASNLKQLPMDSAARSASAESLRLPEHGPNNYHPEWIEHTKDVLDRTVRTLGGRPGVPANLKREQVVQFFLDHNRGDELVKAVQGVEQKLGKDLMKDGVKWIKHNELGERVISLNTPPASLSSPSTEILVPEPANRLPSDYEQTVAYVQQTTGQSNFTQPQQDTLVALSILNANGGRTQQAYQRTAQVLSQSAFVQNLVREQPEQAYSYLQERIDTAQAIAGGEQPFTLASLDGPAEQPAPQLQIEYGM